MRFGKRLSPYPGKTVQRSILVALGHFFLELTNEDL
jgi:hypothetical protein